MQCVDAVVFDFDGVLIESADIKTQAFATLYRHYGEEVAARAVAYHLDHAGISRYVKFSHLHQALLGVTLSDAEIDGLAEEFSRLVMSAVIAAPWVRGAREFVEAHYGTIPLFIASGTPEEELKAIVLQRGMGHYFQSVHGTPATKGEIVQLIVALHGFEPSRVLLIGDTRADFEGAQQAGTRFVGRVHSEGNPFPPGITLIPDLTGLAQLL